MGLVDRKFLYPTLTEAMRHRFIGLLPCGRLKRDTPIAARRLYIGQLFRKQMEWIERNCSIWYIISAKYGVVLPEQVIRPYNLQLTMIDHQARINWGCGVRGVLCQWHPHACFLSVMGKTYHQAIFNDSKGPPIRVVDPFETQPDNGNNGIGFRMWWVKANPVLPEPHGLIVHQY